MGYKTLQDKRKELSGMVATMDQLVAAAGKITAQMDAIQAAQNKLMAEHDKLMPTVMKVASEMEKFDAKGVKEFEQYRASLAAMARGGNWRPLPLAPVRAAVERKRKEIDAEYRAWIAKLAANHPSEIKPGMVFMNKTSDNIYEIKSGPQISTNPNLSGDDKIWFDVICHRDGKTSEFPVKKSDLSPQKGVKYLRTN